MPTLNPFLISSLLICILDFPLFIFLLLAGRSKLSRIFALHILTIFIWGLAAASFSFPLTIAQFDISIKYGYVSVLFIPVFFLHAVLIAFGEENKPSLILIYGQACFFGFLTLKGVLFPIHTHRLLFHSFWFPSASLWFTPSFIIWCVLVSMAYHKLIIHYRTSHPEQRTQILWLYFAMIGFPGGITNFIAVYTPKFYPWGNFIIPAHSFIVAYAVLKYQIFDIKIVFKKSLVYSLLIAGVSLIYLIIIVFFEKLLSGIWGYQSAFFSVIIAFLWGIIFMPLRTNIQRFVDKFILKGSPQEIAQENIMLRQEVAQTEKLKTISTLASGLAHEIKNPLTALRTFAEYLPHKLEDKEFLKKFSKIAGTEVSRINDLVNQLLEFAKPAPLALKHVDINKLLNDTLSFLNNEFIKHKITVQKKIENADTFLSVDPNQMRQVFLNIFLNAVEAMPAGGSLVVKVKNAGESVLISISDTGCGIAQKDIPHIFDPFFSKKDSSTGLGLSIAHGIITEHGGKIRVKSESGKGTTFVLELPVTRTS